MGSPTAPPPAAQSRLPRPEPGTLQTATLGPDVHPVLTDHSAAVPCDRPDMHDPACHAAAGRRPRPSGARRVGREPAAVRARALPCSWFQKVYAADRNFRASVNTPGHGGCFALRPPAALCRQACCPAQPARGEVAVPLRPGMAIQPSPSHAALRSGRRDGYSSRPALADTTYPGHGPARPTFPRSPLPAPCSRPHRLASLTADVSAAVLERKLLNVPNQGVRLKFP